VIPFYLCWGAHEILCEKDVCLCLIEVVHQSEGSQVKIWVRSTPVHPVDEYKTVLALRNIEGVQVEVGWSKGDRVLMERFLLSY
jgi:hypothetical protein